MLSRTTEVSILGTLSQFCMEFKIRAQVKLRRKQDFSPVDCYSSHRKIAEFALSTQCIHVYK